MVADLCHFVFSQGRRQKEKKKTKQNLAKRLNNAIMKRQNVIKIDL